MHERAPCSSLEALDRWSFDDADQAHALLDAFDDMSEQLAREAEAKAKGK